MMKKAVIYLLVVSFFIAASILATYPLITRMDTAVKNLGDPLFNIWVLNWDIHKFLGGVNNFFDANIFYPHTNTLAYSDHLIPQALLALPVFLIRPQPIFIYNFLFILSFILSGLGMFFLVEYLTKNRFAAFLAGCIFAFCPYRFGHLGHLQILSTQWIPFVFLFFHKFIEKSKTRDLVFFSVFFILQALSCSYYALFLGAAILTVFSLYLIKRRINLKKLLLLASAGIITALILFPFFYPYYKFQKEMEFSRPISEVELYSAQAQNYLAVPRGNRLLGKLTERFIGREAELFPGIMVLILASMAIFKLPKRIDTKIISKLRFIASKVLNVFIALNFASILLLSRTGGFDFNLGSFNISFHSIRNPLYLLFFLIILRWLISRDKKKFLALDERGDIYLVLAISSFILSLGPALIISGGDKLINLPYLFLYNHIPGFQGLRVSARWSCFFIFSLSVLAGFGAKRIFEALKKRQTILKWGIGFLLFVFFVSESIYTPISYRDIPQAVPSIYRWLAQEKGDFAIIELPMPVDGSRAHYEVMYMYWSIYHWKSLVNGYSGFFPPNYWPVNRTMQLFPTDEAIKTLKRLGVKYVIIHFDMLEEERIRRIKTRLKEFENCLKIKKEFDEDYVIEVITQIKKHDYTD
ncbi:MAG: hypothetical protein U9Q24_03170 [Candidatus Ratteibacteria bacterium]|nr:hypothetical protein [Candidatus Ratteibacteria bacterium]